MSWQDQAYNAADIIGNGNMIVEIEDPQSENLRTFAYRIDGDDMHVAIEALCVICSGVANTQIRFRIPAGKTASRTMTHPFRNHTAGVGDTWGLIEVVAGEQWMNIYREAYVGGLTDWPIGSEMWLDGQHNFSIQV